MVLEDQEGPDNQEEHFWERSSIVPVEESDILQESVHHNRTIKKDKKGRRVR